MPTEFDQLATFLECHQSIEELRDIKQRAIDLAYRCLESPALPSVPMDLASIPREELEAFYALHHPDNSINYV